MTRLILRTEVSDGYTYHYTQITPIVHFSQQEAHQELEAALMAKVISFFEVEKQREALLTRIDKLRELLDKKPKPVAEDDPLYAEILGLYKAEPKFDSEFAFGGQTLDMHWFVDSLNTQTQDFNLNMPQILTLDEFFREVESR